MPYGPPLYGIFLGHIFGKYGGWGWSELCSQGPGEFALCLGDTGKREKEECLTSPVEECLFSRNSPRKVDQNLLKERLKVNEIPSQIQQMPLLQRKTGGEETQGRGKHAHKTPPKNGSGHPTYDTISPSPLFTLCHFP